MSKENDKRVCIIGVFDFVHMATGGQPVKTRELYYALCDELGKKNVEYIETLNWKRNPFKIIWQIFNCSISCSRIIMLPAHNGVNVFARLLYLVRLIRNTKLFYSVIGGWLPEKTYKSRQLRRILQRFDGIWVETTSMKEDLEKQGFCNIEIIPNFKRLSVLGEYQIPTNISYPLSICTFSRVMKEKGINDAIEAVKVINAQSGRYVYHLDIYGQIDDTYELEFNGLIKDNKQYVKYCGVIPPNKSVESLQNYFALLFPTRFYTEGIPGTLIDAYSAGVPVISAQWKNSKDVFVENETGWSYEFNNFDDFVRVLSKAAESPEVFSKMRFTSLKTAEKYRPEIIVRMIKKLME